LFLSGNPNIAFWADRSLSAAKALAIELSPALLLRADEVIE
jgi:hypothetical protein